MPYIICVNQPGCLPEQSPTATATIEEAREIVAAEIERSIAADDETSPMRREIEAQIRSDARALADSGGAIGPLPDGYVIDVQPINAGKLASLAGFAQYSDNRPLSEIIDAYNGQG